MRLWVLIVPMGIFHCPTGPLRFTVCPSSPFSLPALPLLTCLLALTHPAGLPNLHSFLDIILRDLLGPPRGPSSDPVCE